MVAGPWITAVLRVPDLTVTAIREQTCYFYVIAHRVIKQRIKRLMSVFRLINEKWKGALEGQDRGTW